MLTFHSNHSKTQVWREIALSPNLGSLELKGYYLCTCLTVAAQDLLLLGRENIVQEEALSMPLIVREEVAIKA